MSEKPKRAFGHIAQQLAANGYEPVPIIRGEKRPAVDKWQQGGWENQTANFMSSFTGLLTRNNPAVDIDVSDPVLVEKIRNIVYEVTGCYELKPPRRIGNAPRELLMFRTEEEFQKIQTAGYRLPTDMAGADGKVKASKVEILADGQQFVAYAIHPDTKKPYDWNGGGEPLFVDRANLPVLDESQAREIILRCEELLAQHGEQVERGSMDRGLLSERKPAENQQATDSIFVMAALGGMPNPDLCFDDWIRLLYSAKGGLGEDGREAFMAWSAKSHKHDQAFADKEWKKARPTTIGAGTVIHMAKALGWAPPAVSGGGAAVGGDLVDDDGVIKSLVWRHMSAGKVPRPLNTVENFAALANYLGVEFSLNVISGKESVVVPNLDVDDSSYDNAAITSLISSAHEYGLPADKVPDYASLMCGANQYNPVKQWISSREWDGVSRLPAFYNTIKAKGSKPLKETLIRRWLLSAVASAYRPHGTSAHGVLVLLGPQNLGKTSWFKRLTPPELGLSKDGLILHPDNKDSVKQATSFWLVELGELDATFRKADIAALKAFLTSDYDVFRAAYARKETYKPRRTVFFASVNDDKFLSDPTGNRRFWTIDCEYIDYQHNIDMQQLWAEVYYLYNAGESWYLDNTELDALNENNEEYTSQDPIFELIASAYNWDSDRSGWEWKTVTDVLQECGKSSPSRSDATAAGRALSELNGRVTRKTNGLKKSLCPKRSFF